MKLPRDLSGHALAVLLRQFGYQVSRQTGSHIRLTSTSRGEEHHLTIPAHATLKVGTLSSILSDVARYLNIEKHDLEREIFGR